MNAHRLYFTAGEPSGDLFASEVMAILKDANPALELRGVGGEHMAAYADAPEIVMTSLNIIGYWEGIKAYRDVTRLSSEIAEDILAYRPDAAVLVDSWGLSLRVARKVRAVDPSIPLLKLIGPQVWASRAGRAKTLASTVDHLMCIHDFEERYYAPYDLKTTVIGHPALARAARHDGAAFREAHGIAPDTPLLLVLPGSRASEIARVAAPMIDAARKLAAQMEGLRVCVAPAQAVFQQFRDTFADLPSDWLILDNPDERYGVMAAATAALSCSGTVNNELAVQQTPIVTGYRTGAVSWILMSKLLLKAPYITLLNMAAGEMIVPEFLQHDFTADRLAAEVRHLLTDEQARADQITAQNAALVKMGYGERAAAEISAAAILSELDHRSPKGRA